MLNFKSDFSLSSFTLIKRLFSFSSLSAIRVMCAICVKVAQSHPTLCDPMDYTVYGILLARILEWVAFPSSRGSSQSRDQTQVSYIASRFFTSGPPGKPKNTGWGSPSLLQWIFLTQELNQGLLLFRQILDQLSYQGSPVITSAYLRLLIFLPAILIPACASSSPAFHKMYSVYKLNKQGDNIQSCTPFLILNPSVVPCPVLLFLDLCT